MKYLGLLKGTLLVFFFMSAHIAGIAAPLNDFPEEQAVKKNVLIGMSLADLTKFAGHPSFRSNADKGTTILFFIKPDNSPIVNSPHYGIYAGFKVVVHDGHVSQVSITYEDKIPQ